MNLQCMGAIALCWVIAGCAAKKPAELVDPDRLGDVAVFAIEAAPGDSYPVETDDRFLTTTLTYHGRPHQLSGEAVALPFHQDYEFTFTQRDGIGFVSTLTPR